MNMKHIDLKHEDYTVTLLTKEEYNEYMERIPLVNDWWWLRSPGRNSIYAASVHDGGSVDYSGDRVNNSINGVRPALNLTSLNHPIGEKFIALGNRWVMIDENLAISEDVVTHRRYDTESNVWETSELKAWLEQWCADGERKDDTLNGTLGQSERTI